VGAKTVALRGLASLTALFAIVLVSGCDVSPETRLRRALAVQSSGVIRLPSGVIEVSAELQVAPGAHDLTILGQNTTLKASKSFRGRAILIAESARNLRIQNLDFDGNRATFPEPLELAPPENAFRVWYRSSGILCDQVTGLILNQIHLHEIRSFAILISRSSRIEISEVRVEDSGSLNAKGRNNGTGGIVIEEGSQVFRVSRSSFARIRGNALWTHSLLTSPRLRDGIFESNRFDTVARDAIQVGHASNVQVQSNSMEHIGFPSEIVDVENGGTPVGIDTAGNVDHSLYAGNRMFDINGKCFDLDGFHDGIVRKNMCANTRPAADYPFGHFGIVMNNTDPSVQVQNIEISGNEFSGLKFGAVYLIGSGHHVIGNIFAPVNTAGCNETAARFGCLYKADEPDLLQSGIYLGRGIARLEETRGNVIQLNQISGHHMGRHCVVFGPGVSAQQNTVSGNTCTDELPAR